MSLALPRLASPYLSLSAPLTARSLALIRTALAKHTGNTQDTAHHDHNSTTVNAAVLIPLCNVDNKPSILFEVRGKTLRMHSGEVSFPGGRVDDTDDSFIATALRETNEEVGLVAEQIEILGEVGPPELSLGGMRVWPYVGFIHSEGSSSSQATDLDTPLPSLPLSALKPSQPEVAQVFSLPLADLIQPARLSLHMFRGSRPYWAVDVTDIVKGVGGVDWTGATPIDEVGGGREGRLEVWGLTGWYVSLLMRALDVFH